MFISYTILVSIAFYNWIHPNHDPTEVEGIVSAWLPEDERDRIKEQVGNDMDWKATQNVLPCGLYNLKYKWLYVCSITNLKILQ